ncbi:MAG: hypothetical protein AAB416_04395 [Patescibacteria group bacterium]
MKKIIVGLAGKMASGKGRIGSYLVEKYDADRIRSSDPLRRVLDMFGVPQSRENLSSLSTFLRTTYGENTLAKSMARLLSESPKRISIFDGMRRRIDVSHFRQFDNFYLIYVDAKPEVRYDRTVTRNENVGDADLTREQFDARDILEPEQEVEQLKDYADFVVENNLNSVEHLDTQVEEILKKILKAD